MSAVRWILILGGLALAGCGGKDADEQAVGSRPGEGMAGMPMDSGRMAGPMGMEGMRMMPMMREHMDSMRRMAPARMPQMMATHERMMAQVMDRMGADMRGMGMAADTGWTALTDSVKRDLAELPGLRGEELAARMKAHGMRVERLLAMHEHMVKNR